MMLCKRFGETPTKQPNGSNPGALEAELAKWRRNADQVEHLVKLGSFEVDLDTGALTWSDGTYAVFGLPAGSSITVEEALGFYDASVCDLIARHLERAKASGEPYDLTVPFRTRAGETRWARMIAQVETVAGSKRLFGVIRDITSERVTPASPTSMTWSLKSATSGQPSRTVMPSSRGCRLPANSE